MAQAAPVTESYLRPLDGLRGAAVLLVLAYHASYLTVGWATVLPGGFIGVDLFFVLSGFLITRMLVSELRGTDRIALGGFGIRRIRRLVPALVAAVLALEVLRWVRPSIAAVSLEPGMQDRLNTAVGWRSAIGSVLYVSNYQQAGGHAYVPELSHTWSLAIEAQYYLIWPFVLLALWRLRLPLWSQLGVMVTAIVVVWVHRAQMWTDQAHYLPLYIRTDTRVDVIIAGSILGLLAGWGKLPSGSSARWLRGPALVAVGVFAFVCWRSETGDAHLYRDYGFAAVTLAAMALVASAVVDPHWVVNRVWGSNALRWLGLRSYSLYLWHVPVVLMVARNLADRPVGFRVVVGLVASFGLAELSYQFVEKPFRHRRRLPYPTEAPVPAQG